MFLKLLRICLRFLPASTKLIIMILILKTDRKLINGTTSSIGSSPVRGVIIQDGKLLSIKWMELYLWIIDSIFK
jgi:hypothetical protein